MPSRYPVAPPTREFAACECEHNCHSVIGGLTPAGVPAHRYGKKFYIETTLVVQTDYGAFRVCGQCYQDCMKGVRKNRVKLEEWND